MQALNELAPPTPGRLTVTCDNPLATVNGVTVVASSIEFQAVPPDGTTLASANFSRRIGRGAATALAPDASDPCRTTDAAPPAHDPPLTYQAGAQGFNDGTLRAISLGFLSPAADWFRSGTLMKTLCRREEEGSKHGPNKSSCLGPAIPTCRFFTGLVWIPWRSAALTTEKVRGRVPSNPIPVKLRSC